MAVQLRVPDTNTPASPNTQQQRASNHNALSSEYSLFELETFFTRWAPDGDSVSARGGPSCSFATGDSAECDQDGVVIVETEPRPQHVLQPAQGSAVRLSEGHSFSSAVHIQESVSQGRKAVTFPLRRLSRFYFIFFACFVEIIWSGTDNCCKKSTHHAIQDFAGHALYFAHSALQHWSLWRRYCINMSLALCVWLCSNAVCKV